MHCSKTASSFDYLVGDREQRRRHFQTQRFRGLEIDDQFVTRRCLYWQVRRLLTVQDAAGIPPNQMVRPRDAGAITHQSTRVSILSPGITCGYGVACSEPYELNTMLRE